MSKRIGFFIVGIIIVIGVNVGGYFYINSSRGTEGGPMASPTGSPLGEEVSSGLASGFTQELSDRALARGLHPVEGFNAQMLLDVFPGFIESDFDGVVTGIGSGEGVHTYSDGELTWERTGNQPITSAERSISIDGYQTLLTNVSGRLEMNVDSAEDVTALVDALDIPSSD